MADYPADPPAAASPSPGSAPVDGLDADAAAVLGKLDALLGRLRGPDAPVAVPLAQAEIPTLTEPVLWLSPAPASDTTIARGRIPTLTEPVELRDAPAEPAAPPAAAQTPGAPPTGSPPAAPALAGTQESEPQPAAEPVEPEPAALSVDELRTLVEEQVDPELEARLYEQALEGLEHTLEEARRRLQSELDAWREAESARLREQVRSEIARAVDEAVETLVQLQVDSRR